MDYIAVSLEIFRNFTNFSIKKYLKICVTSFPADSNVLFELKQVKKDTLYEEYIDYFCPPLFSSFCHNTNALLRNIYFNNMIKHFKLTYY